MHTINIKRLGIGLCVLAFAASCSISTTMDESIDNTISAAANIRDKAKIPTTVANQDLVKVKDDIWLGNTSKVEYEGEPLPSYLESKNGITLVSNRPITLYEIGDMINRTTSLGIRYASDIEDDIRSKGEGNRPNGSEESNDGDWVSPDTMMVSYQGPLSGFLDEVSSRFGVWWKYENKDIYFYKFITKTFVVYSLPSKPNMNVNIGGSASGGGGSSSISLSSSIEVEMWSRFEQTISSMVSDGAKITVSPSDGTITLTATPNDIKLVAQYINEQNARLSRQVAISVKIMQVTVTDSDTYGLDLKGTFGDGITSLGITGTQGLASESAMSSLTWGIVKKNWSADAVMQAIAAKNRSTLVTSGTVTTLNNKPAPIQVTQKQNYISEMTKTNSGSDGSNYDISVTTAEIETGFTLDVLPRILEHGRMLVMFNMTLSDLLTLEKVPFGNDKDNQYIQNPKTESRAFTQEVALNSGESLILTGYEKVSSSTDKTGTGSAENSLLGGQAVAKKDRNILVIILTPVVLETPLSPETRMGMD